MSRLQDAKSVFEKLRIIKSYYHAHLPFIIDQHNKNPCQMYFAYAFDWDNIFNVVENMAWESIRVKGNIVLYPQFPVLNFHLDFGNPSLKIGLEIDGAKWHNIDNDIRRDTILKNEGWIIYRVSGKEMMRTNYTELLECEMEYDEEDNKFYFDEDAWDNAEYWMSSTGDGVIEAIAITHFGHLREYSPDIRERILELAHKSLTNHKII